MNSPLIVLVKTLLLGSILLSMCGCETTTFMLSQKGKYGELIDHFKKQKYDPKTVNTHHLFYLCKSYWEIKDYENYFSCNETLLPRLEVEGFSPSFGNYLEPDRAVLLPLVWEAKTNIELGRYDRAVEIGEDALNRYKQANISLS